MIELRISAAIAAMAVIVAGCDTTSPVAPYSPSTANVLAFQSAMKPSSTTVKVGDFTAASDVVTPTCRMAGQLDVTLGKPIQDYVKDALQTELFTAQVYDVNASTAIKGRLDQVKVNTFGTGSWTLALQVTSTADPVGYHVQAVRTFSTSFSAMAACRDAASAFAPTVQDLIGQVVNNEGFPKLVGKAP